MGAIRESKAYKYAVWCTEETEGKCPKYVKMQAAQWLAITDGKHAEAYVDDALYGKIVRVLHLLIQPDLRRPSDEVMDAYAWFLITAVTCTVCRQDSRFYTMAHVDPDETLLRYYQTAVLKIARKNRKTYYSALICILLMLMEPPFSRFFSVAPDLAHSRELQVAINKILKSSPALTDEANPAFKSLQKKIFCKLNDNEYTPLAYSDDNMDGYQAAAWVSDESAAMDSYPIEAMRSSQINLPNRLGIVISTDYPNDSNGFLDEVDVAKKTLEGLMPDSRYFSLIYEPDDELRQGDIWQTDDRCIYQSNPVACENELMLDSLRKARATAVLYENKRENYLCKHNNILYKGLGSEGYIDIQKVKMCAADLSDEWWRGRRVWIGLDLSQTEDNTAVAMLTEDFGEVYCKVWGFIPGSDAVIKKKSERERLDYRQCMRDGECFACGDEVIDYGYVEQFILALPARYGVEIVQAAYDRYNALSTIQKLEAAGIECVEVKQHSSVLHAPTKLLMEMVLNRQFHYAKNRLYEINFSNARCTYDTNMNRYVSKKRSGGKVDLVMATLDALYLVQQEMLFGSEEVIQF